MLLLSMVFAVATLSAPQSIDEEEISLTEKAAIVEQDDIVEDGELIFDDEERVGELEEIN